MKLLLLVSAILATSSVYGKASEQGCESSGGQAAGCTSNTVSPAITVNPTIGVSNELRNFSTNNNNSLGVGVGGTQSQTQTANGGAGGAGGQGGAGGTGVGVSNSSAQAGATNAGNSQTINFTSPGSVKTVGEAPAMITTTTAHCRVAIQASAGWLGGAFGFGTSALDEGCDTREDSRQLWNMGLVEESILRLCAKPEMAKALGTRCPKQEEPVVVRY